MVLFSGLLTAQIEESQSLGQPGIAHRHPDGMPFSEAGTYIILIILSSESVCVCVFWLNFLTFTFPSCGCHIIRSLACWYKRVNAIIRSCCVSHNQFHTLTQTQVDYLEVEPSKMCCLSSSPTASLSSNAVATAATAAAAASASTSSSIRKRIPSFRSQKKKPILTRSAVSTLTIYLLLFSGACMVRMFVDGWFGGGCGAVRRICLMRITCKETNLLWLFRDVLVRISNDWACAFVLYMVHAVELLVVYAARISNEFAVQVYLYRVCTCLRVYTHH